MTNVKNNLYGKGSNPRPYSIFKKEFDERWEMVFGKKKKFQTPFVKFKKINERKTVKKTPYKTKQCPHCATFNLVKDSDMTDWFSCNKCGWSGFDPY